MCAGLALAPVDLRLRYTFDGRAFRLAPESAAAEKVLLSRERD